MVYDPPCQAPAAANVPLCKKRSRLSRTHLATNLVNPTSPTSVANIADQCGHGAERRGAEGSGAERSGAEGRGGEARGGEGKEGEGKQGKDAFSHFSV